MKHMPYEEPPSAAPYAAPRATQPSPIIRDRHPLARKPAYVVPPAWPSFDARHPESRYVPRPPEPLLSNSHPSCPLKFVLHPANCMYSPAENPAQWNPACPLFSPLQATTLLFVL